MLIIIQLINHTKNEVTVLGLENFGKNQVVFMEFGVVEGSYRALMAFFMPFLVELKKLKRSIKMKLSIK